MQDTDFLAGDADAAALVEAPVSAFSVDRLPRGVVGGMNEDRCAELFAEHHCGRNVGAMTVGADHGGQVPGAHCIGNQFRSACRIGYRHLPAVP